MGKPKISRRHFVGAALGIGSLATGLTSKLFAFDLATLVSTLKIVWKQSKAYTMEFVETMPDGKYKFKPTEEVFSFAEQLLHLARANYLFFAPIKGEKFPKPEEEFKPEGKSRKDVIAVVEESFAYGDEVIDGLTGKVVQEEVTVWGKKHVVWKVLLFCVDHITHHRGQMVVYLRLNGIKPPQFRSGFYY